MNAQRNVKIQKYTKSMTEKLQKELETLENKLLICGNYHGSDKARAQRAIIQRRIAEIKKILWSK